MGMNTKSFHSQNEHPKLHIAFDDALIVLLFYFLHACRSHKSDYNWRRNENINISRSNECIFSIECIRRFGQSTNRYVCSSTLLELIRFLWLHRTHRTRNPSENFLFLFSLFDFSSSPLRCYTDAIREDCYYYCWILFTHNAERTHTVELCRWWFLEGCVKAFALVSFEHFMRFNATFSSTACHQIDSMAMNQSSESTFGVRITVHRHCFVSN